MTHISQYTIKPKTIDYWRNPTKSEIKFGHGAIHYRSFDFDKCFDENGFQKLKVKASDDGLIYQFAGLEWWITRKSKLEKVYS